VRQTFTRNVSITFRPGFGQFEHKRSSGQRGTRRAHLAKGDPVTPFVYDPPMQSPFGRFVRYFDSDGIELVALVVDVHQAPLPKIGERLDSTFPTVNVFVWRRDGSTLAVWNIRERDEKNTTNVWSWPSRDVVVVGADDKQRHTI